jgi:murein DD-endopeptidase MepM/ murein hydrolase activator NlpD
LAFNCHVVAVALLASIGARAPGIEIAVASRSLQPGELVVVTLSFAAPPAKVRVSAFGKQWPVYATGDAEQRALVGIDVNQRPGRYELVVDATLASGPSHETRPLIVQPKTFATRTLRVAPDFVDPPAAVGERIVSDARRIRDAYAHSAPERLWQSPFIRPVPHPENSGFGRRSVFNGKPRSPHTGADFASPSGTPIKAPNSGRILLADDLYFTGTTVIIDHGQGLLSTLAHLSTLDVRQGDRVEAGQIIGRVGATGRVTGPHLHWALRVSGAAIDPLSALALLGDSPP